ncbi:hypothetical protein CUMW_279220, partial [Citrus unshiu]
QNTSTPYPNISNHQQQSTCAKNQCAPNSSAEILQRWGLQRPGSKSRPLFAKNSDSNIGTTAAT